MQHLTKLKIVSQGEWEVFVEGRTQPIARVLEERRGVWLVDMAKDILEHLGGLVDPGPFRTCADAETKAWECWNHFRKWGQHDPRPKSHIMTASIFITFDITWETFNPDIHNNDYVESIIKSIPNKLIRARVPAQLESIAVWLEGEICEKEDVDGSGPETPK